MSFYSNIEKKLHNICSKNDVTRTIAGLLSVFFLGGIIGASLSPTVSGVVTGGILGVIGGFLYTFLILDR
jgi:hypothetical protein